MDTKKLLQIAKIIERYSNDVHCNVSDFFAEIETIYRSYQVLLLKGAGRSSAILP